MADAPARSDSRQVFGNLSPRLLSMLAIGGAGTWHASGMGHLRSEGTPRRTRAST